MPYYVKLQQITLNKVNALDNENIAPQDTERIRERGRPKITFEIK